VVIKEDNFLNANTEALVEEEASPPEQDFASFSKKVSRRTFIRATGAAVLISGFIHADAPIDTISPVTPTTLPPAQEKVESAIQWVDKFMGGLVKKTAPGKASLSEYYGFPLQVTQSGREEPFLLGRDGEGTQIFNIRNVTSSESFTASFPNQAIGVEINWSYDEKHYQITLENKFLATDKATIGLVDTILYEFTRDNVGQKQNFLFDKNNIHMLQSLRYTDRHGSQDGLLWALARGDRNLAKAFRNELISKGFKPGDDYHSSIWGAGGEYASTFLDDVNDMFHDCSVIDTKAASSYIYPSKVCKDVMVYQDLIGFDTLHPLASSLHLLNKYSDPTKKINGGESPLEIADQMIRYFARSHDNGIGMAAPPPIGYQGDLASGIRTAHFGALVTELGYNPKYKRYTYDKNKYRRYADRVAQLVLRQQIGPDGIVSTTDGDYYRPALRGGFFMQWNTDDLKGNLHFPVYYTVINAVFDAQVEYMGIIPANAETASDMNAFLRRYHHLVYRSTSIRSSRQKMAQLI
jgi:hypothetical protein